MIAPPLRNVKTLFLAEEDHAKTGSHCLGVVEAGVLLPLAGEFLSAGFYLEDVSGLMVREGAVSVYHFDHFDAPCRATVLVVAPHEKPVFPSIASIYQGAEWHERETRDFYGFIYEGNPNFIPLLLAETMADVHPLTKPEESRAPLATIFSAEGRGRKEVSRADGFTMMDQPAPEAPAPATEQAETPPQAAPKPKAAEAAPPAPAQEEASKAEDKGAAKAVAGVHKAPAAKAAKNAGKKGVNHE